jgi:nucleoside-diphosphate-sugar epimerase
VKSCLIVGGNGFIGSRLAETLAKRECQVRIFDLLPPQQALQSCDFFPGDVRDMAAIKAAIPGVDCVFHCAAQQPVSQRNSRAAATLMREVNVEGTINILTAARNENISKTIFISSTAIYGIPSRCPVDELTAPRPIEDYGKSKFDAERHIREFVAHGLDVTILRPPPVMGPGRLGVFQILFDWIWRGYNLPVFGRGNQLQQWIHLEDCVEACLRAAEKSGAGEYNIGAPVEHTLRQLLEMLVRHAGSKSKIRSFPQHLSQAVIITASWLGLMPIAPFHALTYGATTFASVDRARRELGWQAHHDQFSMLRGTYDWYVEHHEEIAKGRGGSQHQRAPNQRLMRLGRLIP